MKKCYPFLLLLACAAQAQIVSIPDANFKAKLLAASPTEEIAYTQTGQKCAIDINGNGEIEVTEANAIYKLDVNSSNIVDLTGIKSFPNIVEIVCNNNQLVGLDVSGMSTLKVLDCKFNNLTVLDVSGTALTNLICNNNQLNSLDLSDAIDLSELNCSYNQINSLTFPGTGFDFIGHLIFSHNQLTDLSAISMQTGFISTLDFSYNQIGSFSTSIGFDKLIASYNPLTNLELSGEVTAELVCSHANLTTLDFSDNAQLYGTLDCSYNQLTQLSLNESTSDVNASHNQLVTFNGSVEQLDISFNPLENIQLNNFCSDLNVSNTQVKVLDFSDCNISSVVAHDCPQLQWINLKNDYISFFPQLQLQNLPSLAYICCDAAEVAQVSASVSGMGLTPEVNSYCTYTPGIFYAIEGHQRYDAAGDGCSTQDGPVPHLKLAISNGNVDGTIITDDSGHYHIPVQAGDHTLTPIFSLPYFTWSNATVSFPGDMSPATRDFCITPSGVHHDLSISMVPIDAAVPGFDATYRMVVRNQGTEVETPSVALLFDDAVLDFVSATTSGVAGVGLVSWNLPTLSPFETTAVEVSFNLNSPVEVPPLDLDDILVFSASVAGNTDETPADNAVILNQTVVNAYDPNDKTCLEGNTIGPEMAGKYLHYLIRFENTGNYPAQNVRVEDLIDTTKFEIESLEPLDGSHAFVTRITGNKVEFIFNNIMLPFDDANNDGWVLFRIKTKPTLVLGDSVSNTAGIYFNFNPPIITNTATTTFATMGVDSNFDRSFTLWPNPANDIVNLESKRGEAITSVSIYNTLGQELLRQKGSDIRSMNISTLAAGTYVVTVVTADSKSSTQLIKR